MRLNFEELDYNLYQILDIPENVEYNQIKKSYKKLLLKYHPDKNPDNSNEEELYMINMAYKVLKNENNRTKYDNFLKKSRQNDNFSHVDVRKNYQNLNTNKPPTQEEKIKAKSEFYSQFGELDKKHGYNEDYKILDSQSANQKMNQLKNSRNNFNVDYAPIFSKGSSFNSDTFNNKFNQFKEGDSNLNLYGQDIIKSDGNNLPLAYQPIGGTLSQYSPLTDNSYNDLYVEDNQVMTDNFTSLDIAFSLKDSNCKFDSKSIEERLKEREIESDKFKVMGINDFTEDPLDYGILDK